ncbi:hypothetical protein [Streptomyces sp. S.PB5]|uniref:hypothetical protein n=1 Tax=Streptomyces sp. S.PB5 TaxID=3020844 RepID=UPI0025B183DA|nr:hypothetical protein [Streptomyces sp. S.PB5]MDN3029696.1 hypothetical protein [Streptomyces sp. S.PB5]
MNVSELLAALQAQHEAAVQAVTDLREQQARLTGELAEAEARVTELATARKVIESITPADTDTDVDTESATAISAS